MKLWKPQPRTCRICGKENKTQFPYCLSCRIFLSSQIMASTTIKDVDITKHYGVTTKISWLRCVIRFTIRFVIRLIVKFYKWKELREEEKDVEMLISRSGSLE